MSQLSFVAQRIFEFEVVVLFVGNWDFVKPL